MSIFATDGSINLSVVDGASYVGAQAPDGSYYAVVSDGTGYTGYRHPSGAMNVVYQTTPQLNIRHPSGGTNVSTSTFSPGTQYVTVVSGSLIPSGGSGFYYAWIFT